MPRTRTLFIVLLVVLIAALGGWWIGRGDNATEEKTQTNNTNQSTDSNTRNADDVKSIVTYTLPDGWEETSCPSSLGTVYISSNDTNVDCSANPSAPVKISVDPANNKDCNQLQNVQNVSKHTCASEFINGRKSLKAETVYNEASSYKKNTTILAYYIDTGSEEVIKVEYMYDTSNDLQASFEQLAKSIQVK